MASKSMLPSIAPASEAHFGRAWLQGPVGGRYRGSFFSVKCAIHAQAPSSIFAGLQLRSVVVSAFGPPACFLSSRHLLSAELDPPFSTRSSPP